MNIHLNSFALRDQKWCKVPLSSKIEEIKANLHLAKPGYREGVLLVPISPDDFVSPIVKLNDGDLLNGCFERRKDNEEPRKSVKANKEPSIAVEVDVVLYSHATLLEGNEHESDADYEIITFLTKIEPGEQPMPPSTLIANHFKFSGGTTTHMTAEQFEAALKISATWWRDKALIS